MQLNKMVILFSLNIFFNYREILSVIISFAVL